MNCAHVVVRFLSGARGYVVSFEHVAYRLVRDRVPEVGQCCGDLVIAPTKIFFGHAHNKLLDFGA